MSFLSWWIALRNGETLPKVTSEKADQWLFRMKGKWLKFSNTFLKIEELLLKMLRNTLAFRMVQLRILYLTSLECDVFRRDDSHETPNVAFRSATPTSWNCLPKKDVKYSPMGNTAVLQRYLKHKPILLLKRYIWIWGQLARKPDIDVSRHLQKIDTELWDGSWIFIFTTAARG